MKEVAEDYTLLQSAIGTPSFCIPCTTKHDCTVNATLKALFQIGRCSTITNLCALICVKKKCYTFFCDFGVLKLKLLINVIVNYDLIEIVWRF